MHLHSLFLSILALLFAHLVVTAPFTSTKDKRSFVVRDGVNFTVFEHAATGAKVQFVKNSGICETTPGVNQYSGYLSVGNNMNMWFWFFEARNNAKTAPLAAWFNGGPGCSSMIGLFQENGPCHFVNGSSTPSLNPYSFNNHANMLYIDQPIGTGFSYGSSPVDSTETAAPYVWKLLQAFYAQFPDYESRDFGIFTESYGGHYGPEFAYYIQQQNAAIESGSVRGEPINLVALGINNGWFDPFLQYQAYIDYSYNNTYKQLISESQYESYMTDYTDRCLPELNSCASSGTDRACTRAQNTCNSLIETPLSSSADFNVYDIRQPRDDPNPPATYATYLRDPAVVKAIGAKSQYQECANAPYFAFAKTGDNSRSLLPRLTAVVQSNITVLLWAGDADWICNWPGNLWAADAVEYAGQDAFQRAPLAPYTVDGVQQGEFKAVGNLAFLKVWGAGHEVMFYQPKLSLQVFEQTMQKKLISST